MYRIGEFSRIAQVPGSVLRYYDSIDLFSPAHVAESTGYRYYSARQLPDLNRILTLKGLGLPLEQIRRMLDDNVTSEEIRAMLTLRKSQIEQSLQEELGRLRSIESRLQQLERLDDEQVAVVVKTVPEQHALMLRRSFGSGGEAAAALMEINHVVPQQLEASHLGTLVAVMYGEVLDREDIDVGIGFTLHSPVAEPVTLPSGLELTATRLPEIVTAITAARIGGPETAHVSYGAMGVWAEANRYRLSSPVREIFLVPPRPGHFEETIAEIQFPAEAVAEEAPSPTN